MSLDSPFGRDIIDWMKKFAKSRNKPINFGTDLLKHFNRVYQRKEGSGNFRSIVQLVFWSLHEFDWNTLFKIEMLYIFRGVVSEGMKQEIAKLPSARPLFNDKNRLIGFNSADGVLVIEENSGKKWNRPRDEVQDGSPAAKRMRTSENGPQSTRAPSNEVKQEVEEENRKEIEHRENRGIIDHDALRNRPPHEEDIQQREGDLDLEVPENFEDIMERMADFDADIKAEIDDTPHPRPPTLVKARTHEQAHRANARVALQPSLNSVKTETNRTSSSSSQTSTSSSHTSSPTNSTISALQLARGIAAMSYTFKSKERYSDATERIKKLTGADQGVPLEEFAWDLKYILKRVDEFKIRNFQVGSVPIKEFLRVLQTSVVYPLGMELVKSELDMIEKEIEINDKSEEKAALNEENVEKWRIPMETLNESIRKLLRLTFC